ncbi:MAG: nucleoside hydrolase [Puniceicoccaceae bacterium]
MLEKEDTRIPVILDTDANNEVDDQHAIAYTLLNGDVFKVEGLTVNRTRNGGGIEDQYAEAMRVVRLCKLDNVVPIINGASGGFDEIKDSTDARTFDGSEAVDFIIEQSLVPRDQKLVILAVGKLTNVALAVKKDPSIVNRVRLVWLGSNYPNPGEYNLENDIPSMNYLLGTEIPFEMVTVRYSEETGTGAVRLSRDRAMKEMPGLGPKIAEPVTGRHGGDFFCFGDYSANLFEHVECYGDPPSRALFDMAAVAIVKNPDWAEKTKIEAPVMVGEEWQFTEGSNRDVLLWENFDKEAIIEDFLKTMRRPVFVY